jgi:hypothetical protein
MSLATPTITVIDSATERELAGYPENGAGADRNRARAR